MRKYNRVRWYDPVQGPWISQDPISFSARDENLYRYVGNEATGATDPSGFDRGEVPLSPNDKLILDWVNEIVKEMEDEGWNAKNPDNPGEFGTQLHRRLEQRLAGKRKWMIKR